MHLFEKGASTTGSGYDLYLCRKIVEAYGGTIELVDQEHKGAQFRVSLLHAWSVVDTFRMYSHFLHAV